jgi:hypothetical protein
MMMPKDSSVAKYFVKPFVFNYDKQSLFKVKSQKKKGIMNLRDPITI